MSFRLNAKFRVCLRAVAFGLVVLGTTPFSTAMADDQVTLNVWSWQTDSADGYAKIFSIFEAAHPNIKIVYRGITDADYPTALKTGLSGDQGPDLAFLHPYGSVAPYSRAGQLTEISRNSVPELANFTNGSLEAATVDGRIWGIPFAGQSLYIFYDKGLFAKIGVEPPKKATEIRAFLDKIKAAGVVPLAVNGPADANSVFTFDILAGNAYGGKGFLDEAVAGKRSFASDSMIAAFTLYKNYEKYFPHYVSSVTDADAFSLFLSGKAAMYPNGSWMLGSIRDQKPDMDVDVFTMPADDNDAPAPVFGYEDGSVAVSAKSSHPSEALGLLRWMATPQFGQAFAEAVKQASSVKGTTTTDPILSKMISNYRANPAPEVWVTKYFGTSAPAPFTTLGVLVSNLLSGATDPKSAATQLESDAREFESINK